jgi:hypothetical protein
MTGVFASLLLEFCFEQSAYRLERILLIVAVGDDLDGAVVGRSQSEDSHYGLAVDLLPVFLQENIGGKSIGRLDEQGGGPSMDSGPVLYGYGFFDHDFLTALA